MSPNNATFIGLRGFEIKFQQFLHDSFESRGTVCSVLPFPNDSSMEYLELVLLYSSHFYNRKFNHTSNTRIQV